MTPAAPPGAGRIPELGPAFGRLCDPPRARPAGALALDDLRFQLVTGIFDLAGAARAFAAAGDRQGAVASLGRIGWLDRWETAVDAAADRIVARVNGALESAAAESRLPPRRLRRALLTDADRRTIAVRLGSAGGGFVAALDALEQKVPRAAGTSAAGWDEWRDALLAAARRLESAWSALEAAAADEIEYWDRQVAAVRGWRRPTWPVWLLTAAVLALATYLGLVLGGYLPVPPALRGLADYWWGRW